MKKFLITLLAILISIVVLIILTIKIVGKDRINRYLLEQVGKADYKASLEAEKAGIKVNRIEIPWQNSTYKNIIYTNNKAKLIFSLPDDWDVNNNLDTPEPSKLGQIYISGCFPKACTEGDPRIYYLKVSVMAGRGGSGPGKIELLAKIFKDDYEKANPGANAETKIESPIKISGKNSGKLSVIYRDKQGTELVEGSIIIIDSGKDLYFFHIIQPNGGVKIFEHDRYNRDHEKEIEDMLNNLKFLP